MFDDKDDKQTNGDRVCLPADDSKLDNYPDVIAATEPSGVPDVVINTAEHVHPEDQDRNRLPVPEYRKTTLQEKMDNSLNMERKLELLAQHLPQVTEKSSSLEDLLPLWRSSTYEDLVAMVRTSSLENRAHAYGKPVRRSGSAPSMSAKEKVRQRNKEKRKRVSRSSSLNSILETDYEDSLATCNSTESLLKQKRIKRKRKSARDETQGGAPIFSFFTPDSPPSSEEPVNPSTEESAGEKSEQEFQVETRETEDPVKSNQLSNTSNGVEVFNTSDTQIPLSQTRGDSTLEQETATLKTFASSTKATHLGKEELDIKPALIKQVPELPALKSNNTMHTQEKTTNLEDLIVMSGNRIQNKSSTKEKSIFLMNKQDVNFQAHKTVATETTSSSSYKEKIAETKSLMGMEVDMARNGGKRAVRATSWAAEEGEEVEDNMESNSSKPGVRTSERGTDKHLESTNLTSPHKNTAESRKIGGLINRFQDKEAKPTAPKSHTARLQKENTSGNVSLSESTKTPMNTFVKPKEPNTAEKVEQIETKSATQENKASYKHIDSALQKALSQAEIILKKESPRVSPVSKTPKEGGTKDERAFSKLATTSATNSPLASPGRRRHFNKAAGFGHDSVMSELLTRVAAATESHPTQDSNPSPTSESTPTKITNTSLPNGHIPSRVHLVGSNGSPLVARAPLSSVNHELSTPTASTENQEKVHTEDKTDLNHNAVIPEVPEFTGPLPARKSSLPVVQNSTPLMSPTSKKKISLPAPIRLDGGPAPVTGVALMSIMPELQDRLKRMSAGSREHVG